MLFMSLPYFCNLYTTSHTFLRSEIFHSHMNSNEADLMSLEISSNTATAYDEGFGREVAFEGVTALGPKILNKVDGELSLCDISFCKSLTCRLMALSSSHT